MDEFGLIARYFAPLAAKENGAHGLTDDAAFLIPPPEMELVVTKDALVEGVHFLPEDNAAVVAKKLLRVNLSDLAAKGASPWVYFLACMLPRADEPWLAEFSDGLAADQRTFGIALAGGDTTRTAGPLSLSLTAIGTVPAGAALKRSGAQAGDCVFVSGTLGDAALGLTTAQKKLSVAAAQAEYLLSRYHLPQPRLALGQVLRGIATACMDISDGLAQDLSHLCRASRVGAAIHAARVPLSAAAQASGLPKERLLETALTGGDDYELLFTAPASQRQRLQDTAQSLALPLTEIGQITEENKVEILGEKGIPLTYAKTGYRHF